MLLSHIIGDLALPAGVAPALFRLEDGCLWSARPRELKWPRASVLPRVSPRPKRGGLLSSSEVAEGTREVGGWARKRGHDRVVLKWRPVRALLPPRWRRGIAAAG